MASFSDPAMILWRLSSSDSATASIRHSNSPVSALTGFRLPAFSVCSLMQPRTNLVLLINSSTKSAIWEEVRNKPQRDFSMGLSPGVASFKFALPARPLPVVPPTVPTFIILSFFLCFFLTHEIHPDCLPRPTHEAMAARTSRRVALAMPASARTCGVAAMSQNWTS